jgi:hypothetical protein
VKFKLLAKREESIAKKNHICSDLAHPMHGCILIQDQVFLDSFLYHRITQ